MSLLEFLEARLAEDEAVAREASDGSAFANAGPVRWREAETLDCDCCAVVRCEVVMGSKGAEIVRGDDRMTPHIARWDPARALAETTAKRAVVDAYTASVRAVGDGLSMRLRRIVEQFAAVYSDHPDFDPAWAESTTAPAGAGAEVLQLAPDGAAADPVEAALSMPEM